MFYVALQKLFSFFVIKLITLIDNVLSFTYVCCMVRGGYFLLQSLINTVSNRKTAIPASINITTTVQVTVANIAFESVFEA